LYYPHFSIEISSIASETPEGIWRHMNIFLVMFSWQAPGTVSTYNPTYASLQVNLFEVLVQLNHKYSCTKEIVSARIFYGAFS
jgi:hypothetical protein